MRHDIIEYLQSVLKIDRRQVSAIVCQLYKRTGK